MKSFSGTGIIMVLFLLAFCGGCLLGNYPDPGNNDGIQPDVCCKGGCSCQSQTGFVIIGKCTGTVRTTSPIQTQALSPAPRANAPTRVSNSVSGNPDGLLVRYDFEDDFTCTGFIPDESGNNRNADVVGEASQLLGISGGRAIRFSGRGYILAPDNPAAQRKNVSFSFWFRTENPEANYKIAGAAWWRGGPGSGWTMATHVPEFWADDSEGVLVPAQPNKPNYFIPGQWNHEVVTYDGTYIREYTNGNLINSWESRKVPIGTGSPMAVGGWPQYSGYNFIGDLDEFLIYDHPLSPGEISAMYRKGLEQTTERPVTGYNP